MCCSPSAPSPRSFDIEDLEELDDLPDDELGDLEEQVVDQGFGGTDIQELQYEIVTLTRLEGLADKVRISGCDKKWEQLSGLRKTTARCST